MMKQRQSAPYGTGCFLYLSDCFFVFMRKIRLSGFYSGDLRLYVSLKCDYGKCRHLKMRLLCRKIGEITVMNKHLRKFLLLLPCLLLHPEGSRAITVDIPAGEVVSGGDVHSVVTQRVYGEADNLPFRESSRLCPEA